LTERKVWWITVFFPSKQHQMSPMSICKIKNFPRGDTTRQGCSLSLERLGLVSIPSLQSLGLGFLRLVYIELQSSNWGLTIKFSILYRDCQKFSFRRCFGRRLLASGQDRRQTYTWQAANTGVQSTVPSRSKCACAA